MNQTDRIPPSTDGEARHKNGPSERYRSAGRQESVEERLAHRRHLGIRPAARRHSRDGGRSPESARWSTGPPSYTICGLLALASDAAKVGPPLDGSIREARPARYTGEPKWLRELSWRLCRQPA